MGVQKWQQWEEREENRAVLQAWKMAGLSDEEIAKRIGVSRSTLSEWKRKHEGIREALSSGREFADRLVENSLFRLTQGYKVEVRKSYKLKKPVYDDQGKKVADEEVLATGIDDEYVKPDVRAMIFWLQNRRPEDWRKMEEQVQEEDTRRMVVLTPADVERMREYANRSGKDGSAAEITGADEEKPGNAAEGAGSTAEETGAGEGVEAAH